MAALGIDYFRVGTQRGENCFWTDVDWGVEVGSGRKGGDVVDHFVYILLLYKFCILVSIIIMRIEIKEGSKYVGVNDKGIGNFTIQIQS